MENNIKKYNLEERTYQFAKAVRDFTKDLPRTISHIEYSKQIIRSSGSVAANYIEANESLSKKDFLMRVKICRKETKESILWLKLVEPILRNLELKNSLIDEATQLMRIFGAIVTRSL